MRLGANQSEIPVIWEFARATAPVEFMVASGVSHLGRPSKSGDFEEATSESCPVAICRCFRSSLRCSNGSSRSRTSNFPIYVKGNGVVMQGNRVKQFVTKG